MSSNLHQRIPWKLLLPLFSLMIVSGVNFQTFSGIDTFSHYYSSSSVKNTSTKSIVPSPENDYIENIDRGWRPTRDWVVNCTETVQNTTEAQQPFKVLWRMYTLGDCIKACSRCVPKINCGKKKSKGNRRDSCLPSSFAPQYFLRACKVPGAHVDGGNLSIVDDILASATNRYPIPDPNTTILHLRLGDVIEKSSANASTMLWQGANPHHVAHFATAIKSIREYLDDLQSSGATYVEIRGGSHFPDVFRQSRIYAICLRRALERAGYRSVSSNVNNDTTKQLQPGIKMILDGKTPDEDFFYVSHAKLMIVSAGGYSRLMGIMAQRNGGTIIGRAF